MYFGKILVMFVNKFAATLEREPMTTFFITRCKSASCTLVDDKKLCSIITIVHSNALLVKCCVAYRKERPELFASPKQSDKLTLKLGNIFIMETRKQLSKNSVLLFYKMDKRWIGNLCF